MFQYGLPPMQAQLVPPHWIFNNTYMRQYTQNYMHQVYMQQMHQIQQMHQMQHMNHPTHMHPTFAHDANTWQQPLDAMFATQRSELDAVIAQQAAEIARLQTAEKEAREMHENGLQVLQHLQKQNQELLERKVYAHNSSEKEALLQSTRQGYTSLLREHHTLQESSQAEISALKEQLRDARESESADLAATRAELDEQRKLTQELLDQQQQQQHQHTSPQQHTDIEAVRTEYESKCLALKNSLDDVRAHRDAAIDDVFREHRREIEQKEQQAEAERRHYLATIAELEATVNMLADAQTAVTKRLLKKFDRFAASAKDEMASTRRKYNHLQEWFDILKATEQTLQENFERAKESAEAAEKRAQLEHGQAELAKRKAFEAYKKADEAEFKTELAESTVKRIEREMKLLRQERDSLRSFQHSFAAGETPPAPQALRKSDAHRFTEITAQSDDDSDSDSQHSFDSEDREIMQDMVFKVDIDGVPNPDSAEKSARVLAALSKVLAVVGKDHTFDDRLVVDPENLDTLPLPIRALVKAELADEAADDTSDDDKPILAASGRLRLPQLPAPATTTSAHTHLPPFVFSPPRAAASGFHFSFNPQPPPFTSSNALVPAKPRSRTQKTAKPRARR